ncbi:MAG: NAD(P)-dependent oxidoreductase [Candidatus Sericytochromatia bacterium]|nr:NAD(P)-dependent oxidoreductase [Candidatus Sericytochromatia bacterium]
MKRVLVTGATGLIGRHSLAPLLARGYEVHAVTSRSNDQAGQVAGSGICWHQADLLDPEATALLVARVRPTHLLHFAWYVEHGKYWTSPENLRWYQASLYLLDQFQRHGGKRLVMAGTCAEYDWAQGVCDEATTPMRPTTLYGATKHALRVMVETVAATTQLSTAWGRIFMVYGPDEQPGRLVPAICLALLQGQPARCTPGEQIRDLMYAPDIADAFVALLDSTVEGPVNIASGQPVALKTVAGTIAELLARPDLLQLGALAPLPNDPALLTANVDRLQQEVGWQSPRDLRQGLQETIAWWDQTLNAHQALEAHPPDDRKDG